MEVRVAFVCRWLSVSAFFRQDPEDKPCIRHSMVSRRGYDTILRYLGTKEESA